MKLLNYDKRTLILQNLRPVARQPQHDTYTKAQYNILYNLIRQKHIKKEFFDFLLLELYKLKDWKNMNYKQMYELIHILTYYNYSKEE